VMPLYNAMVEQTQVAVVLVVCGFVKNVLWRTFTTRATHNELERRIYTEHVDVVVVVVVTGIHRVIINIITGLCVVVLFIIVCVVVVHANTIIQIVIITMCAILYLRLYSFSFVRLCFDRSTHTFRGVCVALYVCICGDVCVCTFRRCD